MIHQKILINHTRNQCICNTVAPLGATRKNTHFYDFLCFFSLLSSTIWKVQGCTDFNLCSRILKTREKTENFSLLGKPEKKPENLWLLEKKTRKNPRIFRSWENPRKNTGIFCSWRKTEKKPENFSEKKNEKPEKKNREKKV